MRFLAAATVFVVWQFVDLAVAQEKFDPAARAAKIAPLLDRSDSLIMHFDLRRTDPDAIWGEISSWGPIGKIPALQTLVASLKDLRKGLLASGVRDVYGFGILAEVENWPLPGIVVAYVEPDGNLDAAAKLFEDLPIGMVLKHDRLLIFGPPEWKDNLLPQKVARAERIEAALRLAGDTDVQVFLPRVHGEELKSWVRQYPFLVPPWFDHEKHHESLRSLIFSMNFPPRTAAAWIAPTYEESPAEEVVESIERLTWPLPPEAFSEATLNSILKPVAKDGVVRTVFTEKNGGVPELRSVLAQGFGDPVKKQRRLRTQNNLRRLLLASSNYEITAGKPLSDSSADKKPLLSWRVRLLPYLQHQELFDEFRQDEPWDSEHNRKLIARMPPVFTAPYNSPEEIAAGKTAYLVFRGEKTFFDKPTGVRVDAEVDPFDKTYILFEAPPNRAVAWTKPEDFTFDPKDPLKGLEPLPHGVLFLGAIDGTLSAMHAGMLDAKALRSAVLLGE